MKPSLGDVFADAVFWVALAYRGDQYYARANAWAARIGGRVTTTDAVLTEAGNALSRPAWRGYAVALIDRIIAQRHVTIAPVDPALWIRGWDLYRQRPDKGWG